jgi:hypothetical protein
MTVVTIFSSSFPYLFFSNEPWKIFILKQVYTCGTVTAISATPIQICVTSVVYIEDSIVHVLFGYSAPVFFGSSTHPTGRPPPPKKRRLFPETNAFLQARTWAAIGEYLSTGISCTLRSYVAFYRATLHPNELRCTLMSYTAPHWATLYPQSYAAFIWVKLHPI